MGDDEGSLEASGHSFLPRRCWVEQGHIPSSFLTEVTDATATAATMATTTAATAVMPAITIIMMIVAAMVM